MGGLKELYVKETDMSHQKCLGGNFPTDHAGTTLEVVFAPPELGPPPHSYSPHTHSQTRIPYQFNLRFLIAES